MAVATQELERFIHDALTRGVPRPSIESALAQAGWPEEQVRQALAAYAEVDFPVPVPRPRPYLSAREAFLYLVLFAALYVTAWHLGNLLFELIDRAFPDAADPAYRYRSFADAIRWSTASLIVAFPLFLYMAHYLGRELARQPAKRLSAVRRWLTYLTLFIAAGVLVGDTIALVYRLLGGELTLRFLLKAGVVAAIAGTVFGWYLTDLRREERES